MADETIVCPKCKFQFPLSEAMTRQIEEGIRSQFDAQSKEEKGKIQAQAKREAEQTFQSEISELRSQFEQTQEKLKAAQAGELELRKKQRELEESKEALELEVTRQVDKELENIKKDQAKKEAALTVRAKEMDEMKTQLEREVSDRVETERGKIEQETKHRLETAISLEMADLRSQNEKLTVTLKSSQNLELELRQSKRELEAKFASLELEVARRVDEEQTRIREEAIKQTREEHFLRDKEKDRQLDALRKKIEELSRNAEQRSQQAQGEVLELEIEDLLKANFPYDSIEPVPKGKRGADVLQKVHTAQGQYCGTIVWESKRTKAWGNDWIEKLKGDQRLAKAEIAVIVSVELPKEVNHFGYIDGVWVTDFFTALGAAKALRSGLVEIFSARQSLVGKSEKMEMLYRYLSGPEFRQRVGSIIESFKAMKQDLDQEKIALQRIWAKREKQIHKMLESTAGMYGDMQGIIGASLPEIKELEPPHGESENELPFYKGLFI